MKYTTSSFLASALLSLTATASPIAQSGNDTMLLESRSTPTTVTAAILSNLQLFAQFAGSAYCNANTASVGKAVTCSNSVCPSIGSITNYAFLGFDQSQANGYVGIDNTNKRIIVAYAGSANFDNYIADLLAPFSSCEDNFVSGCKLHTGFQYAWGDVQASTIAALTSAHAKYPSYSVVFTGHSLGGAVATIAAAYFRRSGIPCDIYSYGSPRVGNEAFVNYVDGQAGNNFRVTHESDIFARYPGKFLGYRHTSPEFWLHGGSSTTTNYGVNDVKVCTGISSTDCNDGTNSLDTTAHGYYFEKISSCK